MIYPKVREAQPLIIQADVMCEEMTSCCEVEHTGKSIPLLLHQVISKLCRLLSVHKGCYMAIYVTLQERKEILTSVLDSLPYSIPGYNQGQKLSSKIQYCTSEAPLKLLHVYYKHTTYVLHTN